MFIVGRVDSVSMMLGRAIFGSVTHDVLLSPNIPTVVVPKP